MLRFSICPALALPAVLTALAAAPAQQSGVTLSPFVTFLSSGNPAPMTGLSLTMSGSALALRAGGQMSVQDRANYASPSAATRPWALDADALAYLDGLSYGDVITFAPYVFVGMGTASIDSGTQRLRRNGWSYGTGLSLPMGRVLGIHGEYRWRMSRFVMPNAPDAPSPIGESRLGLSFRVGGGGAGVAPGHDGVISAEDLYDVVSSASSGSRGSLSTNAARLLSTANQYVGTRYRRGGASPSSGFDASGFVRFVFAQLGVILPRTSREQARVGERVSNDWQVIAPGDLLLFEDEDGISHVALYAGRNRIIHSSQTGGGVCYDDLASDRGRWFLDHLVAVRRVTPDLRGLLLDLARGAQESGDAETADRPDRAPRPSSRRRP